MHAKYEASISNGSKVIANVKVDNSQTNRQTNKQDKNNMSPIIRSGGIKTVVIHKCSKAKSRKYRVIFEEHSPVK